MVIFLHMYILLTEKHLLTALDDLAPLYTPKLLLFLKEA